VAERYGCYSAVSRTQLACAAYDTELDAFDRVCGIIAAVEIVASGRARTKTDNGRGRASASIRSRHTRHATLPKIDGTRSWTIRDGNRIVLLPKRDRRWLVRIIDDRRRLRHTQVDGNRGPGWLH
jgi:hypothetical protein